MKVKLFLKKLALTFALAVGVYRGAEACAPAPDVTPVFNNAAAVPAQTAKEYRLPSLKEPDAASAKDLWRVRVGAWEIGAGGFHTFVEFSPYDENDKTRVNNNEIYQIHGIACDEVRRTWAQLHYDQPSNYQQYLHGDYVLKGLGINFDHERKYFAQSPVAYVDVFYGSKEDVLKMYMDGMSYVEKLNKENPPYILLGYNSNSFQRTMLDMQGIEQPALFVPYRLQALGGRIWTPGTERSLLPEGWNRDRVREQGGYANLSGDELEKRARAVQGADRMFATFRELPALKPKGPG